MVQTVNGYACYNPADAALAKRGINPAALQQAAEVQAATPRPGDQPKPAENGVVQSPPQFDPSRIDPSRLDVNAGRGQLLNLLA